MALDRQSILSLKDYKTETLFVKEWQAEVNIRTMSAAQRDQVERMANSAGGIDNARARVVALCLCDEQGKLLFSVDEFNLLGEKNAEAVDQIFTACLKLNGMGASVSIEEVAKNSETIPGAASISS